MSTSLPPLGSLSSSTQAWGRRQQSQSQSHPNNTSTPMNGSNTTDRNGGPVETPPFGGGGGGVLKFSNSGTRIGIGSASSGSRSRISGGMGGGGGNIFNQPPKQASSSPNVGLFQQPQVGSSTITTSSTPTMGTSTGGAFSFNNPSRGPIMAAENKSLFSSSSPLLDSSSSSNNAMHSSSSPPSSLTSTNSNFGLRRRAVVGAASASSSSASIGTSSTSNMNMPPSRLPPPKRSMMKMTMAGRHGNFNTTNNVVCDKENLLNHTKGGVGGQNASTPSISMGAQKLTFRKPANTATKTSMSISSSSTSTSTLTSTSTSKSSTFAKPQMDYDRWVVLSADHKYLSRIVSKFESYGTITTKFPSSNTGSSSSSTKTSAAASAPSSNWICIQYESSLQADKAICQHGTLHFGGNGNRNGGNGGTFSSRLDSERALPTIVSVLRMDETLAHNLGLKSFVELGSTGVERLGWNQGQGLGQGAAAGHTNSNPTSPMDVDDSAPQSLTSNGNNPPRNAATVMDESDVLLMDESYGVVRRRRKDGRGNIIHHHSHSHSGVEITSEDLARRDNLCEKVLAWFFEWDDSRDATFLS